MSPASTALLDVNLLIALAWPNHVHHERALAWFEAHGELGWATCAATESGFVRVSSNRRAIPEARSPRECIELLEAMRALRHHVFWTDSTSPTDARLVDRHKILGYRQVTDAHLLAVALAHGGRLATLDRGVESLVPDGAASGSVVCLL